KIQGRRVDFAFDQQTHLPVQVSFYNIGSDNKTYVNVQRFSDYVEVDGIKVPQNMYSEGIPEFRGTVDRVVIKFNVDYDPKIFVKPPAKADPQAWRLHSRE